MKIPTLKDEVRKLAMEIGPTEAIRCLVRYKVSPPLSHKLVKGNYAHTLKLETARKVERALKRRSA